MRPGKTGNPFDCIQSRLPHFQHPGTISRKLAKLPGPARDVSIRNDLSKGIIGWGTREILGAIELPRKSPYGCQKPLLPSSDAPIPVLISLGVSQEFAHIL